MRYFQWQPCDSSIIRKFHFSNFSRILRLIRYLSTNVRIHYEYPSDVTIGAQEYAFSSQLITVCMFYPIETETFLLLLFYPLRTRCASSPYIPNTIRRRPPWCCCLARANNNGYVFRWTNAMLTYSVSKTNPNWYQSLTSRFTWSYILSLNAAIIYMITNQRSIYERLNAKCFQPYLCGTTDRMRGRHGMGEGEGRESPSLT